MPSICKACYARPYEFRSASFVCTCECMSMLCCWTANEHPPHRVCTLLHEGGLVLCHQASAAGRLGAWAGIVFVAPCTAGLCMCCCAHAPWAAKAVRPLLRDEAGAQLPVRAALPAPVVQPTRPHLWRCPHARTCPHLRCCPRPARGTWHSLHMRGSPKMWQGRRVCAAARTSGAQAQRVHRGAAPARPLLLSQVVLCAAAGRVHSASQGQQACTRARMGEMHGLRRAQNTALHVPVCGCMCCWLLLLLLLLHAPERGCICRRLLLLMMTHVPKCSRTCQLSCWCWCWWWWW